MKVLILGASGMIGSAMFRVLAGSNAQTWGTIRSSEMKKFFAHQLHQNLLHLGDVEETDKLLRLLAKLQPDVVVNCIGLTKHHKESDEPLLSISLNALLPHRLAELCKVAGARLVHVSTDCVFAGTRGGYLEADNPDATDVYGRSKHLGEVVDHDNAVTLRTSTIGHELQSAYGLLEWFLSQAGSCRGFGKAVFSGLPNTVFAEVVRDYVLPRPELKGLYHVGAEAIDKYELLRLLAAQYDMEIEIIRDDSFAIDRSLNSARFQQEVGYQAPQWPELIQAMHANRKNDCV